MVGDRLDGKRRLNWFELVLVGSVLGVLSGLAGCGGRDRIARYELSGKVLFDGNPVPSGYLQFVPDRKQGNRGPGASATIRDGQYQTPKDTGIIGGPHVVKITGTDGVPFKTEEGVMIPIGRTLFPEYEVHVDFPRESGTYDFKVPSASALPAKKRKN